SIEFTSSIWTTTDRVQHTGVRLLHNTLAVIGEGDGPGRQLQQLQAAAPRAAGPGPEPFGDFAGRVHDAHPAPFRGALRRSRAGRGPCGEVWRRRSSRP